MKTHYLAVALFFVMPLLSYAQKEAPLKLVQTIPLPDLKEGDFDHFAVDLEGHRLFLTGEAQGVVEVFDTETNTLIHTITGLKAPHAMLYRADAGKLFVVDGDASEVKVYDSKTYILLSHIPLTIDADSIAYDPATKYLYVVNGGREAHTPYSLISVIDTNSEKKLADIKVNFQWLEGMAVEQGGSRLFVNLTSNGAVGVIDRNSRTLTTTWPMPPDTRENSPLNFDQADHRLFAWARKPPRFIVMDSDTGKVIASLPSVPVADEISYDAKNKRIYIAGDQFIDVFTQQDADHYVHLTKIPGGFRAKTAILVPELDRYYLAAPRHGNKLAEVRVYAVAP
ncbi:MAG TPA: YncE family protein [Candidatus Eremiobacteraceae bacterium]|nr:YncE family protein [Candidatus Eremiobacteraceae bacterium]